MKTTVLTTAALIAFAGNSVLCRLALGGGLMDAAGFTSIRLLSGALTLLLLCTLSLRQKPNPGMLFKLSLKHLKGAVFLFVYAVCFSYAYVVLDTGSGALILFGSVQLTMLFASFMAGKRPVFFEWLGVGISFVGLVYLLIPAWGTPSLLGFMLMAVSGLAWGLYTLAGKSAENALLETSKNFIWCIPLVMVLSLFTLQPSLWTSEGLVLAIISGAVTSGLGYAIWYVVLPKLTTSLVGVLQLLVPILAALGGVFFAAENLTLRLFISAILVLGGIYLVIISTKQRRNK